MSIKKTALAALSITLLSFSMACQTAPQGPSAARAVVTGPEDRLYEFHQNVLQILGSDMDKAAITCLGCETLSATPGTPPPTKTITYTFYRDSKRLKAFANAWSKVQTTKADVDVTLTYDIDFPPSDCSALPMPCVSAPYCALRCDKVLGAPCTKCQ